MPEPKHQLTAGYGKQKKGGHGEANWGSDQDEIRDALAQARDDAYKPHSPSDVGAHKLAMSPPETPAVEATEKEVGPSATA
ncbi:hypothetical protein JCM10908_000554 [Rhodotorula pacifica]|uniref:uncharacterized protein n=1 Tax=Rhodotorula pacifica TaxID=1495444 RepID=UPI00316CC7E5